MRRARDVADFRADPVGACLLAPSFVVWCNSPTLCGSIHWARPSPSDLRVFLEALEFIRHPAVAARFDVLMDDRKVDGVDADVLMSFGDEVRARLPEWKPRIRRQAVIVPEGVAGVMLAGLLSSLDPGYPVRFVADLDAALAFLERPEGARAHAEAEAASAERGPALVIERLRAALARDLVRPTLAAVARRLGVSARSLQRQLQGLGTSFSAEVRRARVAAAAELIQLSEAKIEDIALRLGFGSASRMSAAFRRELGVTPGELRQRARR